MSTIKFDSAEQPLPITHGSMLDFTSDPIALMKKLHREHGDLAALEDQGRKMVFAFGPKWNQQVLSRPRDFHSRFFAVRGPKKSAQRRVTSGLLSMNDDTHKEHRRMVMQPFQKRTITHYFEDVLSLTQNMLETWEPGETRDLHQDMNQFMLRVTSGILFGVDQPEMAYRIGELTDEWVDLNHQVGVGAFIADEDVTAKYTHLLSRAEELESEIKKMIDLRRSTEPGKDVLSLMIQAAQHGGMLSDTDLIGHSALLFGAAHLTTAHSLTWTLFLLSQHPEIAKELVGEVRANVAGDTPTLEESQHLPVLERVIKESMRVLPASSYSQRVNPAPQKLGPLYLPSITPVIFSQFMTHHRPDLYPEPEQFRPERWHNLSPSPYAYLPFGAGPRMCLGAGMAMLIMKAALPTMLKRYRLSVVPGAEVSGLVVSTMLGPTTTIPVTVSHQDLNYEGVPLTGNIHDLVELPQPGRTQRRAA